MRYINILLFLLINSVVYGQLKVISLPQKNEKTQTKSSARLKETTITLPFWDDFSWSTGKVDTALWLPGSQVQVITKTGIGIDPPTLNVATFDGVDAQGIPYLNTPTDGDVDSLVSQPIDLTQVPSNLRNTVYLSFFYETKGLGEAPEKQDSLILYLKDVDGKWNKVWPANSNDTYNTDPQTFTERFIQVSDPKYYHDNFQFKFKATGRQNGWFDNWLLDYVYMNQERSSSDNSYLDRAFTQPPSSIFDIYTAIPFDDFLNAVDKNKLFTSTKTKLRNLENDIAPVEYSVNLYDTLNNILIEKITSDSSIVFGVLPFDKFLVELSDPPLNPSLLDISSDSLFLKLEYTVKSGDMFLIDSIVYDEDSGDPKDTVYLSFKNDKTSAYFNLHDYYAYDDGTAEFGAGINQPQGKIAYQYNVLVGKYLDRIDVYFPNVDGNQAGSPLELFVLNDFEGNENSLRTRSNIAINHTGINQFVSYNISPAIYVTDTFYIGFTNLSSSDNWIVVGLDKNTDSYDKIFVNLDGSWLPNTDIHGSLMMRPHFTNEPPVTGIDNSQKEFVQVYPNPSFGSIKIHGDYQSYQLIDLAGREIPDSNSVSNEITYQIHSPQLLLLVLETKEGKAVYRIMANPAN